MSKRSFPKFRSLLRQAIGARTQAEFANQAGLSAQHVNRLLNNKTINRPNKTSLRNIAAVAHNGITYQQMLDALDADDDGGTASEETKVIRDITLFQEKARATFQALSEEMNKNNNRLERMSTFVFDLSENLTDFLVTFEKRYPKLLPVSFVLAESHPYCGTLDVNAERYTKITLSVADACYTAESFMIAYWNPTDSDTIRLKRMDMCVNAIIDLYGYPSDLLQEYQDNGLSEEQAMDAAHAKPYYMLIRSTLYNAPMDNLKVISKNEDETPEESLLRKIFGEEYRFPRTLSGIGFYLDNAPKNLVEFCRKRKDMLLSEDFEEPSDRETLRTALETPGMTAERLAETLNDMDYADWNSLYTGTGAVIAGIIFNETGFPVQFIGTPELTDEERDDPAFARIEQSARPCILLTDDKRTQLNIHPTTLEQAFAHYVWELGLAEFGHLFVPTVETYRKHAEMYTVKYDLQPAMPIERTGSDIDSRFVPFERKVTQPDQTGIYMTKFKDGRYVKLFYLKPQNVWIRWHKEWSHMMESYDPVPLKTETRMPSAKS